MSIAEFDHLSIEKKKELLMQCCGSSAWVNKMLTVFPVEDLVELLEAAEEKWYECNAEDWQEAFAHHPKIGDINFLSSELILEKEKFANSAEWAATEQSGINNADENTLQQLKKANKEYQHKFGFIFIICASGKSANEMLHILKSRLKNIKEQEIKIAAEEQNRITKIRLEKLFGIA